MVGLETFLLGLMITSTITGLTTEAVKTIFTEYNKKYYANTLAGIVSLIVSGAVGVGYVLISGVGFTTQTTTSIIALIFMSWLCAMIGYDKVMQAISQFKTKKDDTDEH